MNNIKKRSCRRAVSGQEGFWIEEQRVVIMVGIGIMGLREAEGSEVRVIEVKAIFGQEGFWIEELCNRDSRDSRR